MQRSYEKEWMDLGFYTPEEYKEALLQLGQIGRFLGGNRATFWAFDKIQDPQSILDVGCGGGHFTILLGKRYPEAKIRGIDISESAISFAKRQSAPPNVTFTVSSELHACDIVTATLVCHHMNDAELIQFLKQAYGTAEKAVIINDLHRHSLAYWSFWLISSFFFNRMVKHDGFFSIRRAFMRDDWIRLLKASDIPLESCSITWHWVFRWIIRIQK